MKVSVFIPCQNEEESLASAIRDLPDTIEGVTELQVILIDDCSTDKSVEIAMQCGVDKIVRLKHRRGLAYVHASGLKAGLEEGADIIVCYDADHQYRGSDLPKLIAPLLNKSADVVVGERPIESTKSFSPIKKFLQRFGSRLVSSWFNTEIPDIASGYRAFTREAAMCVDLDSKFTSTIEAIVKLSEHNFHITSVKISTNIVERPSRLMTSTIQYVFRQSLIILRLFLEYKPLRFFGGISTILGLGGVLFWLRFLVFYMAGEGDGHVQSIIAGSVLILLSSATAVAGLLAHLSASNRRKLEKCLISINMIRYK